MLGSNLGKYVGISFMCRLPELSTWFPIVERAGIVHLDARTALLATVCGRWILKFVGDPVCTAEGRGVRIESGKRQWCFARIHGSQRGDTRGCGSRTEKSVSIEHRAVGSR